MMAPRADRSGNPSVSLTAFQADDIVRLVGVIATHVSHTALVDRFHSAHGTEPTTVSMAYLAQPEQQQQLEWLDGGTLAMLLDGKASNGQLMIGRFDVSEGEAPPYHLHRNEDEVFLLIKGTALVWCDDQEYELAEGGIVYLPKNIPHGYRITSKKADLLMINTPAGIEGMFRETGRDKSTPRPEGFEITPNPEIADKYGNVVVGPPR